jgi:hypothetical protein
MTLRESALQDSAAQDAATQVATAPARVGPPDTSYYMKLGYIVAGAIFAAYILLMLRRIASVRRGS